MSSKDKYILGISAFYHDSAAAILRNGEIIAAAQEERFTRVRHDPRFPIHAINYCIEEAFIEATDIDIIAFYDHPLLTWDRIMKSCLMGGPESYPVFHSALKSIFGIKLWVEKYVLNTIGTLGKEGKILFSGHHMSHLASSYYPSPYTDSALLSLDGVGEWSTTTLAHGDNNAIKILSEINYPHSLGLLYSAFTYYCGFKVNSGEYKLMGLAPYGRPIYSDNIFTHLIDVKEDGSYRLDMSYFGFLKGDRTISESFGALFEGPARLPESRITKKEMDLAASIQQVTETVMLKLVRHVKRITNSSNLCLSGGVALNCVANGKILKENIFKNIWIQPASGDAGGALGACYVAYHHYLNQPRLIPKSTQDAQKGSYLGPSYKTSEIKAFLKRNSYPYTLFEQREEKYNILADQLNQGKIIGLFSGRMEFGPRSLGARSIIGDARNAEMQSTMNLKIKFRESFRPFAPAVLREDVDKYFELNADSPYMLLVVPVRPELRIPNLNNAFDEDMIETINKVRSSLPAITHVDYSARVQTVHDETNPELFHLLQAFKSLTGSSVIVNTSFNVRGEPIVCTPKDAYLCFMRTDIDILVLEDFILYKSNQPKLIDNENWRDQFQLD